MITKDLGAVTAYAEAVEAGYTGTEEEYATLLASYATVAQQAAASASAAAGSATSAAASATEASTTVSGAIANIEAAGTAQVGLVTAEGTTQVGLVSAEGAAQVSAVDAKGAEVIESIPEDYTELSADVTQLKSDLSDYTGNEEIVFTEKKGINTGENVTLALTNDNDINCIKVSCSEGDKFTVTGEGFTSFALWAFYGEQSGSTCPRLTYSGTNASANRTVITAPANAAYLVMNVKRSPSLYQGKCVKGELIDLRVCTLERPIQYERTAFFDRNHSDNLFNIDDYTVGRLESDGTVDATSSTYFTTHYIDLYGITGTKLVPVMGSSTNIGASGWAAYDVNKRYISGSDSSFSSPRTIPSGTRYIRLSYSLSGKYSFAVYVNDTGDGSSNKIFYDNWQINRDNVKLSNWYAGKKASALGDSITANANMNAEGTHSAWRKFVASRMMFAEEIYNCGIGGSRVSGTADDAMWKDARINAIPSDSDVVFFNGGMNDWGANAPLGDEDSTDTSTFYGALNTIAEKLMTRVPNALMVWMTTTFGMYPTKTNTSGLTTYDYGRAIKTVAEKHGFLCVDLHALCGWNQYNKATFVNTEMSGGETVWIHPNENGGKRMTTAICSVLESYQPF